MKTIYFETSHFIHHEGNLVDLCAYREKLDTAVGQNWPAEKPASVLRLYPPVTAPARRRYRLRRVPFLLDLCASLAVVVMAVVVIAQFLVL